MEISLPDRWPLYGALAAVVIALLLGAAIGARVSPVEAARPVLLTPLRWQLRQVTVQVQGEIRQLVLDAAAVRAELAEENPGAIRALTLAQQVYANQRTGTAATAPARQALTAAAAALARYASGGTERDVAVTAFNMALERLQALDTTQVVAEPDAHGRLEP